MYTKRSNLYERSSGTRLWKLEEDFEKDSVLINAKHGYTSVTYRRKYRQRFSSDWPTYLQIRLYSLYRHHPSEQRERQMRRIYSVRVSHIDRIGCLTTNGLANISHPLCWSGSCGTIRSARIRRVVERILADVRCGRFIFHRRCIARNIG